MLKVFLAGPIHGFEDRQEYRDRIKAVLRRFGYEVVDPWERERKVYQKSAGDRDWWKKAKPEDFVRRDLEDIRRCDVFVAYLPTLSAGTCMELFYAKLCGKRTIVVCEIPDPSPWIVVHSDMLLRSIEELEAFLRQRPAAGAGGGI